MSGNFQIGSAISNPVLIYQFDSLAYEQGVGGNPDLHDYIAIPQWNSKSWTNQVLGVAGLNLERALNGADPMSFDQHIAPNLTCLGIPNAIVDNLASNTIAVLGNGGGAKAFDLKVKLAKRQRAAGTKVLWVPMLSRAGCDAEKSIYNGLLFAHWAEYADGIVTGLDSSHPLVVDGAYANTSYFMPDQVHLNHLGFQSQYCSTLQPSVQALLNGFPSTYNQPTANLLDLAVMVTG